MFKVKEMEFGKSQGKMKSYFSPITRFPHHIQLVDNKGEDHGKMFNSNPKFLIMSAWHQEGAPISKKLVFKTKL